MGPLLTFYLSCATVRSTVVAAMAAKKLKLVSEQASEIKRTVFTETTHVSWSVTLLFAAGPDAPVIYTLTFLEDAGLTQAGLKSRQGTCAGANGSRVQYFTTTVRNGK